MIERAIGPFVLLGLTALIGFLVSLALIALLRPWLARHAMAHPNPRSSHREPTPQGGGIAVVVATLVAAWGAAAVSPALLSHQVPQFHAVTGSIVLMALVGAVDDLRPLPPLPRLALQCVAIGIVIFTLPQDFRVVPFLPPMVERLVLLIAGLWFVNLVNFMDGIDWMTVAETVPLCAAIVLVGLCGGIGAPAALMATALLGAMLGFAPSNKPVARLFLGDVGSLPIGVLLGWCLLQLAGKGHVAAALLLPLYYLADATITLARRIVTGERFWQAHRSHFYQRATGNGFTVPEIIARVAAANGALAVLALATIAAPSVLVTSLALAAGAALVSWLLVSFARGKA